MFALGCIQALRCHQNTCPTGVTTHNKRLQRALVVEQEVPARGELRDEHEQGDRHDRPLVRRAPRARAAARACSHRAGERAVGRPQHALSVSGTESQDVGGAIRLLILLFLCRHSRSVRRRRSSWRSPKSSSRCSARSASCDARWHSPRPSSATPTSRRRARASPSSTRIRASAKLEEQRLAELEPRLRNSADPDDLPAISLQQRVFDRREETGTAPPARWSPTRTTPVGSPVKAVIFGVLVVHPRHHRGELHRDGRLRHLPRLARYRRAGDRAGGDELDLLQAPPFP